MFGVSPVTHEQNFCKPSYMVGVVGPNPPDCPSTCLEAFQSIFDCIIPPDRLTEDVGAWSLFSQCPGVYTLQSSPLVSLIKDQVKGLQQRGIKSQCQ